MQHVSSSGSSSGFSPPSVTHVLIVLIAQYTIIVFTGSKKMEENALEALKYTFGGSTHGVSETQPVAWPV